VPATILVVDDDEAVRIMLTRILQSEGYEVLAAARSSEALTALEGSPVALVISDVVMPGGSGMDLRRALATSHPALPVIPVSGFSSEGPAEFAATHPNTEFLQKPFAAGDLLDLVREVLAGGGGEPPA